MFELTGHGMDFMTILSNQAHTCVSVVVDIHPVSLHSNSMSLHAIRCRCFQK